jgi:hypothetical protein
LVGKRNCVYPDVISNCPMKFQLTINEHEN